MKTMSALIPLQSLRILLMAALVLCLLLPEPAISQQSSAEGPNLNWTERMRKWLKALHFIYTGHRSKIPSFPDPQPGSIISAEEQTSPTSAQRTPNLQEILNAYAKKSGMKPRNYSGSFPSFWPNKVKPRQDGDIYSLDKKRCVFIDAVSAAEYASPAEARAELDKLIAFRTRKLDPYDPGRVTLGKIIPFTARNLPAHKAITDHDPEALWRYSKAYIQINRFIVSASATFKEEAGFKFANMSRGAQQQLVAQELRLSQTVAATVAKRIIEAGQ